MKKENSGHRKNIKFENSHTEVLVESSLLRQRNFIKPNGKFHEKVSSWERFILGVLDMIP